MGAGMSAPKLTRFSAMRAETMNSGLVDFDKIFLIVDEVIEAGERLRNGVVNNREILLRIAKVHRFTKPQLIHAFKVWVWCVGACNKGDMSKVTFKADLEDYDNPKKKDDNIADKIEQEVKSGFGALMSFGKKAVAKVQAAVTGEAVKVVSDEPRLAKGTVGECGDFRLELWPVLLQEYIKTLKEAKAFFPLIKDKLNYYIEKVKSMKDDGPRIQELMSTMTTTEKIKTGAILAADVAQFGFAFKVAEQFEKIIPDLVKELDEFLASYEEVFQNEGETAKKVFADVGIHAFYKDENVQVLRKKITFVTDKYMKELKGRTKEELAEDNEFKLDRKNRRPRMATNAKFDDVHSPEDVIPSKYRWLDSDFYDTQFSSASISLNELQNAKTEGEVLRKKLFKLTAVGKLSEKTMVAAFEIFLQGASAQKEGKLKDLELKLDVKAPWLSGKEPEKTKFSGDIGTFFENFNKWLEIYSPPRSRRSREYYEDFLQRVKVINESKLNFRQHVRTQIGPDQYNTLASFCKNQLCNEIYFDRVEPLYAAIIAVNGTWGEEIYAKGPELIATADEHGPECKGIKLALIATKVMPGRLAPEEDRKLRKQESKSVKESRKKRKWLW